MSARSDGQPWKLEAAGSNPATQTKQSTVGLGARESRELDETVRFRPWFNQVRILDSGPILFPGGVMVTQLTLTQSFLVRAQAGVPEFMYL